MSDPEEKIHVMPLGEDWEVEADSGAPLAHEDEKKFGDCHCRGAGPRGKGIKTVIVHDGDGVTEAVSTSPEGKDNSSDDKLADP